MSHVVEREGKLPGRHEFRREVQRLRRPVVFRGAAADGLSQYTPASLRERYGDLRVPVQYHEVLTDELYGSVDERYRTTSFGEFLEGIQGADENGGEYLSQYQMLQIIPDFVDIRHLEGLSTRFNRTNVWIGPAGTQSKLHYDVEENLFWQLHGRKEFILAPPGLDNMYPTNISYADGYSRVDPSAPDYERFPLFRNVTTESVVLQPGDVLYIPKSWWHDVISLQASVSVSHIWWPLPVLVGNNTRWLVDWVRRFLSGKRQMVYGPGHAA